MSSISAYHDRINSPENSKPGMYIYCLKQIMETPTRTNTKNNKKNDVVTIQRTTFRELVAALLRAEAIGVLAALLDAIRKASWSLRITEVDGSFTNIKTTKELRIQLKQQARRLGTKTVIRKLTASNKQIKS